MAVDPFPSSPLTLAFVDNPALNGSLAKVAADRDLKPLCAAVADLTGAPSYAGFNDDDLLYVASVQKLSAMYAAFELRSRVRQQVGAAMAGGLSTATAGWEKSVIRDLTAAWQPKLNKAFSSSFPQGFPALDQIFTFSPSGEVAFKSNGESDADLDQRERTAPAGPAHGSIAGLEFLECMKQMLRWSNNAAASRCIRPLSYPYINGLLGAAGFFERKPSGSSSPRGLWLSGDYQSHDWLSADQAAVPLTPRWFWSDGKFTHRVTNFAGTARQLARLLTLLAQDKLVTDPSNPQVCGEMRGLLSGVTGIGSYIGSALASDGRSFTALYSKIGWGDDTRRHDCAIVERTVGASDPLQYRYVVVGLGGDNDLVALSRLFVALDKLVT
jgi:hypothetical protein